MTEKDFAQGVSSEDLRVFLEFWPQVEALGKEISQLATTENDLFYGENSAPFSWCHIYELPIKEHMAALLSGFLADENFMAIYQNMVSSKSQISAMRDIPSQVDQYFETLDKLSKAEIEEVKPLLGALLCSSVSSYNTMRCILYHGCFLNELIQRIPLDDKALFDAVRIDPTVVGCKPALARISKATLLEEDKFFSKLKAALTGKIAKREQANFQKMRLVLEVLHEAGATRLTDAQLHEIFVEELKLYSANEKGGGSAKALRKFAGTYMKKKSTT